ncbi:MAG: DGQHR domain-containing protein [Candidatus Riflebacteria bacterium]|nr:DGQHR domain-containing protein [Candidatus Riflebacteria bacterium]
MSILRIPSLRGLIGDWIYYVSLLPFSEIAKRIKKTDEIHKSHFLREMIQRALSNRSKEISSYIEKQPQRFFNSIVVGVYDGKPEWSEITLEDMVQPSENSKKTVKNESMGILTLSGEEKLFAIDGQHRVEGIREALEKGFTSNDEVCTIFVAHKTSEEGIQRTRRLFTTLNRYAKPVSLTDLVALDEDDIASILTRELIENHNFFNRKNRVSLAKTVSINPKDKQSVTSLQALYKAVEILLQVEIEKDFNHFRKKRPEDNIIEDYKHKVFEFWDILIEKSPAYKKVLSFEEGVEIPDDYRSEKGGNLLFRPVAYQIILKSYQKAHKSGMNKNEFLNRFSKIPLDLNKLPWFMLLWNGNSMITESKNQSVAVDSVLYLIGTNDKKGIFSFEHFKKSIETIFNKRWDEINFPKPI